MKWYAPKKRSSWEDKAQDITVYQCWEFVTFPKMDRYSFFLPFPSLLGLTVSPSRDWLSSVPVHAQLKEPFHCLCPLEAALPWAAAAAPRATVSSVPHRVCLCCLTMVLYLRVFFLFTIFSTFTRKYQQVMSLGCPLWEPCTIILITAALQREASGKKANQGSCFLVPCATRSSPAVFHHQPAAHWITASLTLQHH